MADDIDAARIVYERAIEADQDNRREAATDLRFSALEGQWDERLRAQREREGRPCFTFDRTGQIVRQIVGDFRLNPPSITVRPVDNGADPKLADTLTGVIRNIESASMADAHYIAALESAVRCGMGFLRVRYDYVDDASLDMDFRIEHIPSPFSAVWDPGATLPCREDGQFWFVTDMWTEAAFKERWPKASLDGWDTQKTASWRDGDFVRVAEYWFKESTRKHILFLADGRTVDATDLDDSEIAQLAAQALQAAPGEVAGVKRERWADSYKVRMRLMNGVEQLEETVDWPGKYIPISPIFGEEIRIGDRIVRRGVIRPARDAQIRYNVQATALTEAVAMAPKSKWIGTAAQFKGYEKYWGNAHLNNYAYLPYNPDPQAPGPPQRNQPEPPPGGLLADIQAAAMDIEASTGVYRENLGRETNAVSGRAILSRQREGDVGTFLYADNAARGVGHVGRIIVDAAPRVFDQERVMRVLGEDGKTDFVVLNQRVIDQMGRERIVNDLSAGRYDVVASTGPAFSTRREEARESMVAFMQANPNAAMAVSDLFAHYQDWPGSEEIAKRLRKIAVAQGIAEPEDGDQPPPPPPPDPNMLLAQAEMAKAQAAMAKAQADAQKAQVEAQVKMAELQIEAARLDLERQRLGLDAADTESEIRTRAQKVAVDAAKVRVQAQGQLDQTQDRRVNMAMGEHRARRNEFQAERRDVRALHAKQNPSPRPAG